MLLRTPVLPQNTTKRKELKSCCHCKFYKEETINLPFSSIAMKSYLVKGSALKYLKSTLPLKNLAVAYAAVRSLMMLTIHLKIHSYFNSGCVFFRDNLNSDYIHTYHP